MKEITGYVAVDKNEKRLGFRSGARMVYENPDSAVAVGFRSVMPGGYVVPVTIIETEELQILRDCVKELEYRVEGRREL